MKRIFGLAVVVVMMATSFVFAENEKPKEKPSIIEEMLKQAVSPIDTVIESINVLKTIVVTPSKLKEKLGAQSSSVSVLNEKDFAKEKVEYVKSALKNEMGIDVVESGSFTGQTSVFMRGANSNHTLVMVDGVKVYDPMAPSGAFNFAHLTLDNIGQIEVVRGSQSALYGSDAIGGVINIITKEATEPFFNASFETGSFSTFIEKFGVGSKNKNFSYTVGGSHTKSRGISNAQAKNNNPELDGYERYSISARADYEVTDDLKVGTTFRNTSTRFGYDQFRKDYPNLFQRDYQTIFSGYLDHNVFDFYNYYIKLGWMYNLRRDNDDTRSNWPYYLRDWYSGYLFKLDYRNNFNICDVDTLTIGYEYTWEMGDYYYFLDWGSGNSEDDMPKVFSRNSSLYLQNRFNLNDRLTSTQGLRVDSHTQAGTHVTYKVDGSYLFPSGTKIRGGWATGFKAPTLYQLHAVSTPADAWGWGGFGGGNLDLKPETSRSYEMGLDQYMFSERVMLSLTYFNTMLYDLINTTTNSVFYVSKYENTGKARSYGIELGGKIKPVDNIELSGTYTHDYTKDLSTDMPLLRRPLDKAKVLVSWKVMPKLDFGVEVLANGLRYDINSDKLKPYAIANLNANYKVTKHLDLYMKFINILNKRYEEVRGFGESPFAVYVGTKAEF